MYSVTLDIDPMTLDDPDGCLEITNIYRVWQELSYNIEFHETLAISYFKASLWQF